MAERRVKSMYIRAQDGKARPSIKRDADAAHFAHLRDLTGQGDRDLSVNAIKNRKRPHIPSLALGGSGPPGTGPNPNNMLGAVKDGNPNMGDYGAESESSEDEDRAAIMVVHSEKGFVPPTPRPFDVIDPGDGWRLLKPKHLPGDFVTLTTTSRPLGVRLGDGMNAGPPREMPGTVNPATELGYECFVPPPHAKAMFIGDVLQETERFDSMAFDGAAGGGGGGGGGASALAFASMSADGDASLLLGAGEREKREEQLRKAEQDMAIMDLTNTAFTAVRNNSMAQLEELLDDGVSAKDARDAAGNTLLHLAAQQVRPRSLSFSVLSLLLISTVCSPPFSTSFLSFTLFITSGLQANLEAFASAGCGPQRSQHFRLHGAALLLRIPQREAGGLLRKQRCRRLDSERRGSHVLRGPLTRRSRRSLMSTTK